MTTSWRTSALADRHRALGSALEDWNGMGTPWTYAGDLADMHEAIRTRVGIMDVSGLKKVHYAGPHAEPLLQEAVTRDVGRLSPGQGVYATMLDDAGHFVDDCIVYRTGANTFFVVHGAGKGHEQLTASALGRQVAVLFDDDLHDLSLQGPLAVDLLERHVPGIRELRYFRFVQTELFGRPLMISRTGYTGERGYELFCKAVDAGPIWDGLLESGADLGILPCAFTTLDWLRVESSLLFYPYDNSELYPFADEGPGDSLWELGLDFTVTPGKTGFRGAYEHARLEGRERFRIAGILLADGSPAAAEGDTLWAGEEEVGVITCAMASRLTSRSMALARLAVPQTAPGTPLEVRGSLTVAASVQPLPFDDPEKTKRTAVG